MSAWSPIDSAWAILASLNMAMNDYGFEIPLGQSNYNSRNYSRKSLFDEKFKGRFCLHCVNESWDYSSEFRESQSISGWSFNGYPGNHGLLSTIQANSSLLLPSFYTLWNPDKVFLLKQAQSGSLKYQRGRINSILAMKTEQTKISDQGIHSVYPFSFPIMVDRLIARSISSESIEDRVAKDSAQFAIQDEAFFYCFTPN